jgi:alpha-1,6-mannosyltransferase
VIGDAGIAAPGEGSRYAQAVLTLLARPGRRQAARDQACRFPWAASVDGFLAAHIGAGSTVDSSGLHR